MAQIRRFMEVLRSLKDDKLKEAFRTQMFQYDCTLSMRLYVHFTLFRETLWAQGTPEQFNKWSKKIENMNIIGCFAMTELGHSSYLRGIETIATYIPETREFVIHSQSLTATKWWIGMAGQTATHTVCLCNLVIRGKTYGLHWFLVPLRSPKTGNLYPGVSAGHLGPKYGRNGLDNGWIQLSQVRVPRENMLMKWSQVSEDGTYTASSNSEIAYATLIGERYAALNEIFYLVSQALVIAIRYGIVRQQGPNNEQLYNFQNHQYHLTPILAGSYAIRVVFLELSNNWNDILEKNDKSPSKEFSVLLKDNHCTAAGLKAWLGWWGADSLELIRRSLGGHAYSAYSNIPSLIGDYGVLTTGGGDNYVLAQQCTKFLLKNMEAAMKGKEVGQSVSYFKDYKSLINFKIDKPSIESCHLILEILASLSVRSLLTTLQNIQKDAKNGKSMQDVYNDRMVEIIEGSKAHTFYTVIRLFDNAISKQTCEKTRKILNQLCNLLGLSYIEKLSTQVLIHKIMSTEHIEANRENILSLCKDLRHSIVLLSDGFDYPDWVLKTALGRYDGNIYEHYFKDIVDGGSIGKAPYWEKEVLPILSSKL